MNLREFVDFDTYQVFEGVTTYTCLLFLNKEKSKDYVLYKKINKSNPENISLFSTYDTKIKESLSGLGWDLNPRVLSFEDCDKKVGDLGKIFTGMETGLNEVMVIERDNPLYDEFLKYEGEIIHKYLKGDLVERYHYERNKLLVITPYDEDGNLISETNLQSNFPEVYSYLLNNKDKLEQRENGKMKGDKWYGYVYPKNLNQYSSGRLIWMDIAKRPEFAIDRDSYWHSRTVASLQPEEESILNDLLGLLNSKLFLWYMNNVSNKVRGGYLRFKPQYVREFPIHENYDSRGIASLTKEQEENKLKRKSINLNFLDYLGNYSKGKSLDEIYVPVSKISDTILTDTQQDKDKLRIGVVDFEQQNDTVILRASARYKPDDEAEFAEDDLDRWGYTETELIPAMKFTGDEMELALIREFTKLAVNEASGFANFREKATKTMSILDRLEKLTLPKLSDVESGLEKYLEQKEKAERLEEEIRETDHTIDAIVFDLYDLTEEEVETVLDSLGTEERDKEDIMEKFKAMEKE